MHTHPFLSNYVRFLRRRTCNCCFWGHLWAERLLEKSLDLTLASVTTWATVVLEQPDTFEIRASCVSDVNGSGIHNPVVLELHRVNFLCFALVDPYTPDSGSSQTMSVPADLMSCSCPVHRPRDDAFKNTSDFSAVGSNWFVLVWFQGYEDGGHVLSEHSFSLQSESFSPSHFS